MSWNFYENNRSVMITGDQGEPIARVQMRSTRENELRIAKEICDANRLIVELTKRIAELEEKTRWIPVEERLPADGEEVFVLYGMTPDGIPIEWYGTSTRYESHDELWRSTPFEATHWMSIPPKPEVKE